MTHIESTGAAMITAASEAGATPAAHGPAARRRPRRGRRRPAARHRPRTQLPRLSPPRRRVRSELRAQASAGHIERALDVALRVAAALERIAVAAEIYASF